MEICTTFLGAHEVPPGRNKSEYLDEVCEVMIPECAEGELAEFCDVFCEKGVYTVEEARRVLTSGLSHGLRAKIHADQMTDGGGAALAAEVGAVSADHLDYTSLDGLRAMKRSGTIPVILPGAVFFLGLRQYPPVRKMMEEQLPVAMATDFNPGSCMSQNVSMIMTIACTQCRMSIPEALTAFTLNAAHAMDRGKICGSIEVGKRADFVILDVDNYEMLPYHFGHNHIKHVICKGRHLVNNFTVNTP